MVERALIRPFPGVRPLVYGDGDVPPVGNLDGLPLAGPAFWIRAIFFYSRSCAEFMGYCNGSICLREGTFKPTIPFSDQRQSFKICKCLKNIA